MAAAKSTSGARHSAARCDGDRRPIGADASRERRPLAEPTWRKLWAAAASSTRIAQKWRLFTVGGGLRSRSSDDRQNRRASRSAEFSPTTLGGNRRPPTTSDEWRRRRQPGGARSAISCMQHDAANSAYKRRCFFDDKRANRVAPASAFVCWR